jgi:hypothetical protein
LTGPSFHARPEGITTFTADSGVAALPKMDVLKVGRSDPKGMPRSPCLRHVLLVIHGYWLKMDDHNLLLQVKRKREALQSERNFDVLQDTRARPLKSVPEMLIQMMLVCGEARWLPKRASALAAIHFLQLQSRWDYPKRECVWSTRVGDQKV